MKSEFHMKGTAMMQSDFVVSVLQILTEIGIAK
jgi:hypothetical protein